MGLTLGGRPTGGILPTDYDVGPLPIDQFINAGHITGDKIFSTNFASQGYKSFIDFGPYKTENMASTNRASFLANYGYFWAANPEGVRFGNVGDGVWDGQEYKLDSMQAIFSSASIFSGVPESLSANFFKILLAGKESDVELDHGVFYTSCYTTFDTDLYLMFGSKWLQIKGSDLVVDVSAAQDGSLCAITFMPSKNDHWWLGLNLYKDYYVIHNASSRLLEFAPTLDRIKDEILVGSRPTMEFPDYDWRMMLVKMGVGAMFALGYWATIRYVMLPTRFTGIHFLNQATYKPTKKQQVAKKIAELDTETV